MTMKKPRLTLQEARWIAEVDDYVTRFHCGCEQALVQSFSDVHDSGLYPAEVTGLVRKRLLRRVKLPRDGEGKGGGLLGDRETVDLTPRAMRLFWPDLLKWRQHNDDRQ